MNQDEIRDLVHALVLELVDDVLRASTPPTAPWYRNLNTWVAIMSIPAGLTAVGILWVSLGFPTVATSADIQRLDRQQAEIAVTTFQNAVNSLIATTPSVDAPLAQQKAWQQQFDQTNKALDRAISRKIELTK